MNTSGLGGLFFMGRFFIINSISLIDARLFMVSVMVSVSSWVSFDHFYLSRNLSISSQCGIYWHKAVHNSILLSFIVCWICSDVLSFIPDNWFVWGFFCIGNFCLFSSSVFEEVHQFYCGFFFFLNQLLALLILSLVSCLLFC